MPLLLHNGDTLCFAKGSHTRGIGQVADYLSVTTTEEVECNDVVPVSLGDCILFDARVYHASTSFPAFPQSLTGPSLRIAIGIQWLTPGGLDGLKPGVYHRWPDEDIPPPVPLQTMRENNIFGMDTAGHFLKIALITLEKRRLSGQSSSILKIDMNFSETRNFSTLELASRFSNREDVLVIDVLHSFGCDVEKTQKALLLYTLYRKAAQKHYGETQGPKIFKPLYDHLIVKVLSV